MVSIVISLGTGLYYILNPQKKSDEAVKALTVRIGLSLTLFIILFFSFAMGWLKPHSLLPIPIPNKQTQTEITTPHLQNANTKPPLQNQNGAQE